MKAPHIVGTTNPTGCMSGSVALHYVVAVAAALAAWGLRTLFDPYLHDLQPFATFYVAVAVMAWWAGLRPALVTLVLGYFLAHWFFLPPRHAFAIEDFADVVQHFTYFFVTGAIVGLIERLRRSRERATASARLAEHNEVRFRTMAETVPDIIFTSRPDGTTDFVNQRFFEYAGPKAAVADFLQLLHPDDVPAAEAEWQECVRKGRDLEIHCRIRGADGSYRWFLRRARPVFDEGGGVAKWVGCCTDIDEQKRNSEELERRVGERTARLQEMLEEMEHLSYSIAHDMRSPLRAMTGYATLLQDQLCPACQRSQAMEFIRRIQQAAARMDRLIQDVLSYSGVVRQSLPLHPVELSGLVSGLVHSYPNLLAHESNIEIRGNLPTVVGNEAALSQCFGNLLDNAVKFVPADRQPAVRVWAQPLDPWVRVWVEDNGIGIPRELHERIFDLFQTGAPAHYEGTGLGLAIARKLVHRMDGEIGVDSELGKGSRFWVDLRLAGPTGNVHTTAE